MDTSNYLRGHKSILRRVQKYHATSATPDIVEADNNRLIRIKTLLEANHLHHTDNSSNAKDGIKDSSTWVAVSDSIIQQDLKQLIVDLLTVSAVSLLI